MLLCINVSEDELLCMTDEEKLMALRDAYHRALQVRRRAENYDERRYLVRSKDVLDDRQKYLVNMLYEGWLD